jgi:hypothetical protein
MVRLLELRVGLARRLPPSFLGALGKREEGEKGKSTWTEILNDNLSSSPEKGGSGGHVKGALAIGCGFFDRCSTALLHARVSGIFADRMSSG